MKIKFKDLSGWLKLAVIIAWVQAGFLVFYLLLFLIGLNWGLMLS